MTRKQLKNSKKMSKIRRNDASGLSFMDSADRTATINLFQRTNDADEFFKALADLSAHDFIPASRRHHRT